MLIFKRSLNYELKLMIMYSAIVCDYWPTIKIILETLKVLVLFPETSGTSQPECSAYCSGLNGQLPMILNEEENEQLYWQANYHGKSTWLGKLSKFLS